MYIITQLGECVVNEIGKESLPPKYSRRFLVMFLNNVRQAFREASRNEAIADYAPSSLARFDESLSNDIRSEIPRMGHPEPDLETLWFFYAMLGSYFGDVLVHNLGGNWRYPNSLVALVGLTFGRPDWIYRRWYVVVGRRKIPVFVIAMRRHTLGRDKASLVKAYEEIARTCGKPNQGKGARS